VVGETMKKVYEKVWEKAVKWETEERGIDEVIYPSEFSSEVLIKTMKETRKQTAKEIFAGIEKLSLDHLGSSGDDEFMGFLGEDYRELKKKYLGDMTFLNKKAQPKKVKK